MPRAIPHKKSKKHTNFYSEIDGSTHYDKQPFFDFNWSTDKWTVYGVVAMILVAGVILMIG